MATGDIVQFGAYMEGTTTVEVSTTKSQPSSTSTRWTTPTSGNTLFALVVTPEVLSGFTAGWTQEYASVAGDWNTYVYSKTSAGNETSAVATMDATNDHFMSLWEIEGTVTYDQASGAAETATATVGTSLSPSVADTLFLAMCEHWQADDNTNFDNGFTKDWDYDSGAAANSELYYQGGAHKLVASTASQTVNATWTTAESGTILLVAITVSSGPVLETRSDTGAITPAGAPKKQAITKETGTLTSAGVVNRTQQRNKTLVGVTALAGDIATQKYIIRRPDATVAAGGWDTGPTSGQSLHGYTSDASDSTWIETTLS